MAKEMNQQTEEQIRTRAYYLWEADGCPQGRDSEYWMKAQQEQEIAKAPAAPAATSSRKKSKDAEETATQASPKRRNGTRTAVYA